MKPAKDTRSEILDVALDMVQRLSISGVSFQELARRVGIKKGSMYYHFESKDDLSVALMERASEDLKASFARGREKSPVRRLRYFFSIYIHYIGPGHKICPGGAFAAEWENQSAQVQQSVRKVIQVQQKGVTEIIQAGLDRGEFTGHGQSAEALACWVLSCLQGAVLISRVEEQAMSFDASIKVIESYLNIND